MDLLKRWWCNSKRCQPVAHWCSRCSKLYEPYEKVVGSAQIEDSWVSWVGVTTDFWGLLSYHDNRSNCPSCQAHHIQEAVVDGIKNADPQFDLVPGDVFPQYKSKSRSIGPGACSDKHSPRYAIYISIDVHRKVPYLGSEQTISIQRLNIIRRYAVGEYMEKVIAEFG